MSAYVDGTDSQSGSSRACESNATNARPTTASTGIVACAMSPNRSRTSRESAECDRWSPNTHNRPAGTLTSNASRLAGSARPLASVYRYGSSNGCPLSTNRCCVSQHTT